MNCNNIYIAGQSKGSYRTQNLIKFLLDNEYNIYYNSIHLKIFSESKGLNSILRKIVRFIDEIFKRLTICYNIIACDVLIIPAMCNHIQFELIIARIFRKKIITDFYLSIYDTIVLDKTIVKKKSRKAKYYYNIDLNLLKKSNYIFFLNQTEADYYLSLFNISFNPFKHIILPLCIEESIKCKLKYFQNKNKVFNICWWGNYLPLHGLDVIIESISFLRKKSDLNVKLYIFGNENQKKILEYTNLINSLDLQGYVIIKSGFSFKNGKLSNFLKENCDLVMGNFGDSSKAKNVLANKVLDGIGMKSPVLNGESIAPKRYFSEKHIFYSINDPNQISNKILEISKLSEKEINYRVRSSYEIFLKSFSTSAYYSNLNKFFTNKFK